VAIFRVFVFVKLGTAVQDPAYRFRPDESGAGKGEAPAQTGDFHFRFLSLPGIGESGHTFKEISCS
jgi:hypothetical protein